MVKDDTQVVALIERETHTATLRETGYVVVEVPVPVTVGSQEQVAQVGQTPEQEFICVEQSQIVVVAAGQQGPPGAPGAGEEMKYSKRVDFVGEQVIYKGESVPGSLETESKWRIRKITFVGEDIFETWADGDSLFNKQWSNRESYNYI